MTTFQIRSLFPLALMILHILTGCGENQPAPTGSATFTLQWEPLGKTVGASTDICSDYGLQTITASYIDGSGVAKASGTWACADHKGTVTGIPVASGYTVRIEGFTSAGSAVAWRGEKTGVAITANADTPVGSVPMNYVGTVATVKLSSQGTAAAASIKGIEVTFTLPAGVTLKAAADGIPSTGVVTLSGVAPTSASMAAKYTAATRQLTISIASSTGFGTGEFVTISADVASGTVPLASQFTLPDFTAFGVDGAAISGVTAANVGLVLR